MASLVGLFLEAIAEIPHEVAEAAEHVVHQRPGVAEQDELADMSRDPIGPVIGLAGRRRDQPPGDQQRADIERPAGDAVNDRHDHGGNRLVDLQMRR